MGKRIVLAAGILLTLGLGAPAWADDCTPHLVTSLDMIDEPDGRIAIAVGVGGGEHRMLVAVSEAHSELFQPFVSAVDFHQSNLPSHKSFRRMSGPAVGYAHVDTMMLGTASGSAGEVLVTRGPYAPDTGVVGVLGADILANFDVELDFKAHRMNLFASNPCDGHQAYWSTHASSLPMGADDGTVSLAMTLDGRPVKVDLDTLVVPMRMPFDVAKDDFALDRTSPGVTPLAETDDRLPAYHYTFGSLNAGDININKPVIVIFGNPDAMRCNGQRHHRPMEVSGLVKWARCYTGGDLALGIQQLRTMHLYFAYKARKLYFTPIAPRQAAAESVTAR
jgi:hypothetical protein